MKTSVNRDCANVNMYDIFWMLIGIGLIMGILVGLFIGTIMWGIK